MSLISLIRGIFCCYFLLGLRFSQYNKQVLCGKYPSLLRGLKMMKYKNHIKATVFILLFSISLSFVARVLTISASNMEYQWMAGIYEEPENSLDAVYLGSSNCYAFWNPNLAWEEYGITVYPYACSSQPLIVAEYLIKEARKTQPDAVYIVNINTLGDGSVNDTVMHRLLDFMPLSQNKLDLTDYLCDLADLSFSDRLEYYIPLIRYHEKWAELTADNFSTEIYDLKGGNTYSWYLGDVKDVSKEYKTSDESYEISDALEDSINSLLDYCDEEDVKIVFVTVPRAEAKLETVQKFNTVNKLITDRGYPIVDLMDCPDAANIDPATDYYNNTHTNVHGSLKLTHYISEYLVENYGFEDKRQDEAYSSWNESYEKYADIIAPYVLDIELDPTHRDFELFAPNNLEVTADSKAVTISWDSVQNADGYTVYKQLGSGAWSAIKDITDTSYFDTDVKAETVYSYTVVPYKTVDGKKMYGNYLYNGLEVCL